MYRTINKYHSDHNDNKGEIRQWASHMFDENYIVRTKPPIYYIEGKKSKYGIK